MSWQDLILKVLSNGTLYRRVLVLALPVTVAVLAVLFLVA